MDSISGDNSFAERQSGFGTIPGDELVDGVPVPSLGFFDGRLLRTADRA
jgi:hypothetical protein